MLLLLLCTDHVRPMVLFWLQRSRVKKDKPRLALKLKCHLPNSLLVVIIWWMPPNIMLCIMEASIIIILLKACPQKKLLLQPTNPHKACMGEIHIMLLTLWMLLATWHLALNWWLIPIGWMKSSEPGCHKNTISV